MEETSTQILLKHYDLLLELYEKLDKVSQEVFLILKSGSSLGELTPKLKANAAFANQISNESHIISSMKIKLVENDLISDNDRTLVRKAENKLAKVINRVIKQETKSREIIEKQGVKISRK